MNAVSVHGLTVKLAGEKALDDIGFSARRGEFLAVVGANGAGKSTLLRAMNGGVQPDDGGVTVQGRELDDLSSGETARKVAYLPQSTEVSFEFTVEEVVRMGRHPRTPRIRKDPNPEAAIRAMERMDVRRFEDRSVDDVSGGERRRVLLARCLAQATPILLLDEPTANLDVHRAVEVLHLVRSVVDGGKTVVAAIHDVDLAARFGDRVAVLDDGRLRAIGEPEDVLSSDLLEDVFGGRMTMETKGVPRLTPFADSARDGGHVHVVGNGEHGAAAVYRLWNAGLDVTAGAVSRQDEYAAVVDRLADVVVYEEPYSAVSEGSVCRVRELVEESDAVVVAPSRVPEGWKLNLEAVASASDVHLDLPESLTEDELARCREGIDGAIDVDRGTEGGVEELLETSGAGSTFETTSTQR